MQFPWFELNLSAFFLLINVVPFNFALLAHLGPSDRPRLMSAAGAQPKVSTRGTGALLLNHSEQAALGLRFRTCMITSDNSNARQQW